MTSVRAVFTQLLPFDQAHSDMTIRSQRRAIVFATGTLQWSWALDDHTGTLAHPNMVNLQAQQLMRNVLRRMLHPVAWTLSVPEVPAAVELRVWPHPYRGGTLQITGAMPAAGGANELVLVDLSGRELRRLPMPSAAGELVRWDGRDDRGREVPSGIVFVRASGERTQPNFKLIVIR